MQLIYATGEPRRMAFGVAATHASLPLGSIVYAICDGTSAVERLDEFTYSAMSVIEYLTFRQMFADARRRELKRSYVAAPAGAFRRFLQWISGQTATEYRQDVPAF